MPQASDRQRALMEKWFGDPISDEGPINFLQSHGYILRRDWHWELPTPSHSCSCYEMECIMFLADEWDFGGVVNVPIAIVCLCGQGMKEH